MSTGRHLFSSLLLISTISYSVARSVSPDIAIINPQVGNTVNTLAPAITSEPCSTGSPLESAGVTSSQPISGHEDGDHYGHLNANHKEVKRYSMAGIEFHRVETPFIISFWILSASLAKIGKWIGNTVNVN